MNPGIGGDDPSIYYYDSDYPSPYDTLFPENFDPVTEYQGLAFDIERYRELIRQHRWSGSGALLRYRSRGHSTCARWARSDRCGHQRGHVAKIPQLARKRESGSLPKESL